MHPRHILLALLIVLIWGVNFAIIALGLRQVSPLALGVVRFFLAAFPFVFFVKRPAVPLRMIAAYGLLIFALQFGFLFTGMKIGMSAGLASLILQLQVFFTIGLSVLLLGERPNPFQLMGAALAFIGVGTVALHVGGEVTGAGLVLMIAAAAAWGGGNIVSKRISQRAPGQNPFALVVWGSLFAGPMLLVVALLLDPSHLVGSLTGMTPVSAGAILYIVYLSTLFCFAMWNRLLGLYAASAVAPFTLMVPVFGFLGSAVLLGEPLEGWKLMASSLVIVGLCLNLFGPRLFSPVTRRAVPPPSRG